MSTLLRPIRGPALLHLPFAFAPLGLQESSPDSPWLGLHGVTAEAVLTTDLVGVARGGVERDLRALTNLDLTLELDTERAGLWENGRAFLYLLDNRGRSPSERVGDLQVTDNIETESTFKVYEAWYEHSFGDGASSLLVGLHDYNAEFYVLESASVFLNSSFGIGPEVSQAPPSIFATTALGVRLRVAGQAGWYSQYAAYDGVPGDPGDPKGTQVILDSADGVFHALEVGWVDEREGRHAKLGLGGWYLDRDVVDFAGQPRDGNEGGYLIAERDLHDDLTAFLQLGLAGDHNVVQEYAGCGLQWAGVVLDEGGDSLGLGVAHARGGDEYLEANPGSADAETAIELTWSLPLHPRLTVQPDLQYVIDPGFDRGLDDALVLGLRVVVSF